MAIISFPPSKCFKDFSSIHLDAIPSKHLPKGQCCLICSLSLLLSQSIVLPISHKHIPPVKNYTQNNTAVKNPNTKQVLVSDSNSLSNPSFFFLPHHSLRPQPQSENYPILGLSPEPTSTFVEKLLSLHNPLSPDVMKLHISPSLRHVTVLQGKGVREFINVKVIGSRKVSYRMLFYMLLLFTFLVRLLFVLTTVDSIDGLDSKCSSIGCLGKKIGPKIMGRRREQAVPEIMYQILKAPVTEDEVRGKSDVPQTLEEFVAEVKESTYDARAFALRLREMVVLLEQRTRNAKIQEYLYRHVASSSIPKQLHCLTLKLADEHSTNAAARMQLPLPELVPTLVDNAYYHFVLATDNVLAASVVATSLVQNSLHPDKMVLHLITDKKTYSPMQAWFSLHSLSPAVIEVRALHHFDWFAKGKVPVLEAMEKDQRVRSQFRGGSSAITATNTEKPHVIAAKLQALSPKYNSMMNHIRIHLPELFPSLNKVVFLDDDIVIQTDLSPLWDIDMDGKVNGAVQTCKGDDKFVMSKRLKSYLNFSHPLIRKNFDPNECAWAYGMNIFDLEAWRKTNISLNYYHWLEENLKSDLSLWQLGTLPPGLIAFHGHVHVIDPFWHMLGLGYQENTSLADAENAGVIHFNGRAKPWLEIAFPILRTLWAKYVDFGDKFIRSCHISVS